MKAISIKAITLILSLVCILSCPVQVLAAPQQGTNGDELQLVQPQQLEIQLGTDWAGTKFKLKTDAGMYPGEIVVGEDGFLRLEIGGSSFYKLSTFGTSVEISNSTQAPATTETQSEPAEENPDDTPATVSGIPVWQIVLFAGGMVAAIGGLITMSVLKKRRESEPAYDEDEDE